MFDQKIKLTIHKLSNEGQSSGDGSLSSIDVKAGKYV